MLLTMAFHGAGVWGEQAMRDDGPGPPSLSSSNISIPKTCFSGHREQNPIALKKKGRMENERSGGGG